MMETRKRTMETTTEARVQSALLGMPLRETNVNEVELPDVTNVIESTRPGMWIHGDVVQYDDTGAPIPTYEDAALPTNTCFRVDDNSITFSKAYVEKVMAEEAAVSGTGPEPGPEPEPEPTEE